MIINVSRISPDGERLIGEEPAEILELGEEKRLKVEGPVRFDLFAQKAGPELIVQGKLGLSLAVECSRCADFFSTTLEDSSFLRAYPVPEGTETVDLTGDIREDILLNLPVVSLCSPACKGLCPRCGKNLNEGPCSCRLGQGAKGTWSALDKLDL
ncbi:MAG: DUF177 domain-containing protein [Verrucomicrobiota bacterium]